MERLLKGYRQDDLDAEDRELFKKWAKAVERLRDDPEDRKRRGYDRVSLSNLPPLVPPSPG